VDNYTDNFGQRLRGLIEQKKISIDAFADSVGIARSTAHLWLKRKDPVKLKHRKKLTEFFGVSEPYLAHGMPEGVTSFGFEEIGVNEPSHGPKHVAPEASDSIEQLLRSEFEALLAAASGDHNRLCWLRVELDQLRAFARTWLSNDDVNRRVIERRLLDADHARSSGKIA